MPGWYMHMEAAKIAAQRLSADDIPATLNLAAADAARIGDLAFETEVDATRKAIEELWRSRRASDQWWPRGSASRTALSGSTTNYHTPHRSCASRSGCVLHNHARSSGTIQDLPCLTPCIPVITLPNNGRRSTGGVGDCHVGQGLLRNRHFSRRRVALSPKVDSSKQPPGSVYNGSRFEAQIYARGNQRAKFVGTFHEPMKEQGHPGCNGDGEAGPILSHRQRVPLQTCLIGSDHAA
jgi:hypothetical protein